VFGGRVRGRDLSCADALVKQRGQTGWSNIVVKSGQTWSNRMIAWCDRPMCSNSASDDVVKMVKKWSKWSKNGQSGQRVIKKRSKVVKNGQKIVKKEVNQSQIIGGRVASGPQRTSDKTAKFFFENC
jgi:hypothetical protein